MSDPTTPFLGLIKPIVNDEAGEDLWGDKVNGNFDKLDAGVHTNSSAITVLQGSSLTDSPHDGKTYGRKDAGWVDVSTSVAVDWANITGKPSVFPPELPIPQSGVTGLVADQAAQNVDIGRRLIKTGDAMTGELTLVGDPSTSLGAATKSYVDNMVLTAAGNFYTKGQSDARFEPIITAGTTAQYWRGNKTWATLDKSAVGLGNVDNTSDAAKPISSAQATVNAAKEDKSNKAIANGYASLGSDGKVPPAQLPPAAPFPEAPTDGAIYGRRGSDASWQMVTGVTISDTPPASPRTGDLWWESDTGLLYVRYQDANSSQWVITNPTQDIQGLDTRYVNATGDQMTGALQVRAAMVASPYAQTVIAESMAVGGLGFGFNAYLDTSGGVWNRFAAGYSWVINNTPGSGLLGFYSGSNGAAGGAVSFTTPMTLDAAGALTVVSAKAGVNGFHVQPADAYSAFMAMDAAGTHYQTMGLDASLNGVLNISGGGNMLFQAGGTTRLTMPAIGTILQPAIPTANNYSLLCYGSVGAAAMLGYVTGGTVYGMVGAYISSTAYSFYGNVGAFLSAGAWQTCDARLKTEIDDTVPGPALDIVDALPVHSFVWKQDTMPSGPQLGWFAQEVETVLPDAVTETGIPAIDLSTRAALKGVPMPEADTPEAEALGAEDLAIKTISDHYMVGVLWRAVQELTARVKELEAARGV